MKLQSARTQGFTVVELLVVMVVTAILSSLVFSLVTDARMKNRDTERATDIDIMRDRLEEYYNDNGGYPNTFSTATLTGINPASLVDPNNVTVSIISPVANQDAARDYTNPTNAAANYLYIPYPTGCGATTCTGYVLKSFIEQPTGKLPNPYQRYGLNNN